MTEESDIREQLEALFLLERKAWLNPGSYDPKGFDEALAAAKAAGEKAFRQALGRRRPTDDCASAYSAAFRETFTKTRRAQEG